MNEDFTRLQQLLRLKRHEQPPPEYFEDLVSEARYRQPPARPGWVEWLRKVGHSLNGRSVITWGATAYAALMLLLWLWPRPDLGNQPVMVIMPQTGTPSGGIQPGPATIPVAVGSHNAPISAPNGLPRTPGAGSRDRLLGPREDEAENEPETEKKPGDSESEVPAAPQRNLPGPKQG